MNKYQSYALRAALEAIETMLNSPRFSICPVRDAAEALKMPYDSVNCSGLQHIHATSFDSLPSNIRIEIAEDLNRLFYHHLTDAGFRFTKSAHSGYICIS